MKFTPARQILVALACLMLSPILLAKDAIEHISSDELNQLMSQGVKLIDIRTEPEWQQTGVVEGAHTITLFDLSGRPRKDFVPRLEALLGGREQAVALICRSGNRSATVAKALVDRGKHVVDVAGGTAAWSASGHPLVRSGGGGAWSQLLVPVMASLTLGLAPFLPEPHLVGKIRWVAGGAVGMGPMDWFDLAMHGAPFLWLAWTLVRVLTGGNTKAS